MATRIGDLPADSGVTAVTTSVIRPIGGLERLPTLAELSNPLTDLAQMKATRSMLCPVILGRDDLLQLMDEQIAEASAGRGRALFLSGQAGLGKTRLIRATIRKAEMSHMRVNGGAVAPQDL